jgi:hypothetical protein
VPDDGTIAFESRLPGWTGHITRAATLHGQPFLGQLGVSTFQWSSVAIAALRRHSNPMPITVPNYNPNTDRLQFGTLIDITSES